MGIDRSPVKESATSPASNSTNQATPATNTGGNITIDRMYNDLMTAINTNTRILDSLSDNFHELRQNQIKLEERMIDMEHEKRRLDENDSKIMKSVEKIEEKLQGFSQLKDDLAEETNKIRKLTNLIVFGIPEKSDANRIIEQLLQLVLPAITYSPPYHRLGKEITEDKPRPIKITLNCLNEVNAALGNGKLLKGKSEFQGIYIQKDLTKRQQDIRKLNREARQTPPITRARASKRTLEVSIPIDVPTKKICKHSNPSSSSKQTQMDTD